MPRLPKFSRAFWLGVVSGISVAALGRSWLVAVAAFTGVYLSLGGWRFMRTLYTTLPRDIRGGMLLFKVSAAVKRLKSERKGIHDVFEETVQKFPNKVAIIFEGQEWTFQQIDQLANQVAHYLRKSGFHPGDTIALFMDNCPEYVALYMGMSKIGVAASLINYHLRSDSLVHCIRACNATGLVFGINMSTAVEEVRENLNRMQLFCLDGKPQGFPAAQLELELRACPTDKPEIGLRVDPNDVFFYIYTSGTTGLPKAAKISHSRFMYLSMAMSIAQRLTTNDIIYTSLPLYHTNASMLGVGVIFQIGATVVLRRKFSASHFWEDCCQYKCTAVQYIGEICRYLLAQPPRPSDTQHQVRVAYGNGLQKELWERFQSRFHVPRIGEFYGSTEGNVGCINTTGKVGACGYLSKGDFFGLYPVRIIKRDETTGQPVRDSSGLCVVCQSGEPGEVIGLVKNSSIFRQFDGYTSKEQTEKKLIRDVKQKGDVWFSSGDVLVQDDEGYVYFVDRTGDTFRWKGENVSTREVETVMSDLLEMRDVAVFGVPIPKIEGKAGMAVIAADQVTDIDLIELQRQLAKKLPQYAHPIFIRIVTSCDLTGTFKLKKGKLQAEGYNAHSVTDPLFYLDTRDSKRYKVLDGEAHEAILRGTIRF